MACEECHHACRALSNATDDSAAGDIGNGDLDTNLLGVPTEGYGFGNGAAGSFGPAEFDASSIDVKEAATIRLPIGY